MEGLSGEGDVDEASDGQFPVDDSLDDLENDPAFKPIQAGSLTALDIFYEVIMTNSDQYFRLQDFSFFLFYVC